MRAAPVNGRRDNFGTAAAKPRTGAISERGIVYELNTLRSRALPGIHNRFPPDISHERGKTAYVIRERFVASVVLPDCRGPIMDTTAYSFATSASHFAIFL